MAESGRIRIDSSRFRSLGGSSRRHVDTATGEVISRRQAEIRTQSAEQFEQERRQQVFTTQFTTRQNDENHQGRTQEGVNRLEQLAEKWALKQQSRGRDVTAEDAFNDAGFWRAEEAAYRLRNVDDKYHPTTPEPEDLALVSEMFELIAETIEKYSRSRR